ncbi:hypothetical protein [Enterococcus sp. LJL90]
MAETLYTIRQIADIAGVSKVTMYRYITENSFHETLMKRNAKMYDETTKNLILKGFSSRTVSSDLETAETVDVTTNLLKDQVKNQQLQLAEKDEQIKQLHKLLDQQQQLSLQDKNQVKELKERISELEGLIVAPDDFQEDTDINTPEEPKTSENVTDSSKKRKWFQFWK